MKIELPYEIGTFVKIISTKTEEKVPYLDCGTIIAYEVFGSDNHLIWVSGYRDNFIKGCFPEEVVPMTKEEINRLKEERDK